MRSNSDATNRIALRCREPAEPVTAGLAQVEFLVGTHLYSRSHPTALPAGTAYTLYRFPP